MKLYMTACNFLDMVRGDIVLAQKIESQITIGPSRWVVVGCKGMSTMWLFAGDLVLL